MACQGPQKIAATPEGCGDEEAARPTGQAERQDPHARAAGKRSEASGEERQEQEGDDGGAEAGEAESFAGEDVEIGVKHAVASVLFPL